MFLQEISNVALQKQLSTSAFSLLPGLYCPTPSLHPLEQAPATVAITDIFMKKWGTIVR